MTLWIHARLLDTMVMALREAEAEEKLMEDTPMEEQVAVGRTMEGLTPVVMTVASWPHSAAPKAADGVDQVVALVLPLVVIILAEPQLQ